MAELIESGRIVDVIVLVLVAEGVVLAGLLLRRRGRALPTPGMLLNLAAAGCLLLGLRATFSGAAWTLAGMWLGAALLAHVGELLLRLRDCDDNLDDKRRGQPGRPPQNKA